MSERTRFYSITLLLIGALALSVVVTLDSIQTDLLSRTQAVLASGSVAYYGLQFDGRDAIVGGFVPSRAHAEHIVEIVGEVPGVRKVFDELIIDQVIESPSIRPRAATTELRLQRMGSLLMISGHMSESDAQSLVSAAENTFGHPHVRFDLLTVRQLRPTDWLANATAMVRIMSALSDTGRLSVYGTQAVLGGRIRGNDDRQRIDELTLSVPELRWHIELHSADGHSGNT